MNDNKLLFWTGAPGSKWSATAWCLSKTKKLNIDTSDQAEHRCYVVDDEEYFKMQTEEDMAPSIFCEDAEGCCPYTTKHAILGLRLLISSALVL